MYIRRGRHPHEVALLLATTVIGVAGTFAFNKSASAVARALTHPYGQVMYAGMAVGSLVAIAGIFWPGVTGALVERSGLWTVSLLCLGQGAATVVGYGWRALAYSLILAAIAIASFIRIRQIRKEAREMVAMDAYIAPDERQGGVE